MERVLMLEHHREDVEGGFVSFYAGSYYIVNDPLRQQLIDAKKAVPESEALTTILQNISDNHELRKAVLAVPAPPEVAPIPEGVLDIPEPPPIPPIEVEN
jgi:hypothetical protein